MYVFSWFYVPVGQLFFSGQDPLEAEWPGMSSLTDSGQAVAQVASQLRWLCPIHIISLTPIILALPFPAQEKASSLLPQS